MEKNVRSVIQNAADRKRMPAFSPGSMRDLALKLRMSFPVSLLDLLRTLNDLLPAGVTYDSGRFVAGYVHASAQLYLQSDGAMSFSGQVHESGVVGDNFVLAMALLDVKDASGKPAVWVHSDTVAGQLAIGFSDKEWHDYGFNQLVKDNWDAVKNTRVQTVLQVSTDPWQVTELVVIGLFIAIGTAIGGAFIVNMTKECSENGQWRCGWRPVGGSPNAAVTPGDPGNPPGAGLEYLCRCEFN
jgi:hypothetical protein